MTTSSHATVWPFALTAARLVDEFLGRRLLEDAAAERDERLGDAGEVLSRVNAGLPVEADARLSARRGTHRRIPRRIRAPAPALHPPASRRRRCPDPLSSGACRYPSTHSKPASISWSRTIWSICAIAASPASQTACAWSRPKRLTSSLRRASVTIVRCALVCPGVDTGAAPALEQDHALPRLRQQIRRRQAGDAAADDHHVGTTCFRRALETAETPPSSTSTASSRGVLSSCRPSQRSLQRSAVPQSAQLRFTADAAAFIPRGSASPHRPFAQTAAGRTPQISLETLFRSAGAPGRCRRPCWRRCSRRARRCRARACRHRLR